MSSNGSLRSIFEPGSTRWAVRRAQWRAMGISASEFDKPKIAVVNSSSALSSCYRHLDQVSELVQDSIREAGGLPFEVHTVAPSDFITSAGREGRFLMPSRDLIVNDIEVMIDGALLDGMVCLSSCDKTTPAHLMAAARLNIPTILLVCGYQTGGHCNGRVVDINDLYEAVGAVRVGDVSLDTLAAMSDVAICGSGVCAGLGTANSMHIVAEALGMTLPGNAPILASSEKLTKMAAEAGRQIVRITDTGPRPRDVLVAAAFANAVRVVQAVGGSVNTVRHLAAVASEARADVDVVGLFEETAEESSLLCEVRPNGRHRIEDLERAGGARGVMKRISSRLNLDLVTITGLQLGSLLEECPEPDADVIYIPDEKSSRQPGIAILRGNIAPQGAIVKLSAYPKDRFTFVGPAKVFSNEKMALDALEHGEITSGDVVVLPWLGPKGGPGTVFAAGFVAALNGAGLARDVALITDGELSGLNRGITIGQVMPEAADGGPIAIIKSGDTIEIDIEDRRIDLVIAEDEMTSRVAALTPLEQEGEASWLTVYAHLVGPIYDGAVLGHRLFGMPTRGESAASAIDR